MEADRSTYIGASEAAAVVGLSRWDSPIAVWQRKVGLAPEPETPQLRMWLGRAMEPILLDLFASREGRRPRTHQRLVRSNRYPFIGAHPDYVKLEVKTARSAQGWGEDGTLITEDNPDAMPLDYFLQVQQQMFVTGWGWCDVAVLIGFDDFRTYRVMRAPGVIDNLVQSEVTFWHENVETGIPPELDDSDAARDYLRRKFPRDTEPLRIATPEEADLLERAIVAQEAARLAEQNAERLRNQLRSVIGPARGLTDARFRATWTAYETRRIKADAVRALLTPDELTQVQVVTTDRRLTLAPVKED